MSKKIITDAEWNIVLLKLTALRGDLRGLEWKAAQDLQRLDRALTPRISKLEADTTGTTPDHSSLRERIARLEKMVSKLLADQLKPTQGLNGPDSEVQMACDPTDPTRPTGRLDDAKTEYHIPRVPNVGESVKSAVLQDCRNHGVGKIAVGTETDPVGVDPANITGFIPVEFAPSYTNNPYVPEKPTLTSGPRLWNVVLKPQCKCDSHEYQMCYPLEKYKQIRARSITAAVSLVYELYPELSSTYRVISVTEVEE